MRAHPAGPLHADVLPPGSTAGPRPSTPDELDRLLPDVWPRNAHRGDDGAVRLSGVDVRALAAEFGTPLFVVDEADFRARCAEHAAAFGDPALVHYASKAFLSMQIARWVAEEGLSLDVCSGGELAIESQEGDGTTVRFTLPTQPPPPTQLSLPIRPAERAPLEGA